ncbi:MAG: DegV family protein [Caldisericia bacterium]|nr:DegV family protein [Caldisericia bacterium]
MDRISTRRMFSGYLSGAKELMSHKNILNKINVFPVPDSDTGTNLFSTMKSVLQDASYHESTQITLHSIAESALKGARGNSGIIFAQYLYGLSMETANEAYLTLQNFVVANQKAVKYAFDAVAQPVHGTILTVIQKWAESLQSWHKTSSDFEEVLIRAHIDLENAVSQTTKQLKVLKQNHVVDSGAKGFALFIKGFIDHLQSGKEEIPFVDDYSFEEDPVIETPLHHFQEITFRYCSEAIIEGANLCLQTVRKDCANLGDSLIVAGGTHKIHAHIHTNEPQVFFKQMSHYGKISYQKIDDMKMQMNVATHQKYPIALVTDTIADIPQSFIDDHQIHVIPLHVFLGEENYIDRFSIRTNQILDYMDQNSVLPTSAQPDYKDIENTFRFLSTYYSSILVLTVSSKLSGTHSIISTVAKDISSNTLQIHVMDSKLNAAAQGLMVMKCVDYLQKGLSIDQIKEKIQNHIQRTKILVHVKSIDNMIKSGRLSHRMGSIAKAFHLRPIVTLDADGKGTLDGIAFKDKQSQKKILRHVQKTMKNFTIEDYAVVHANNLVEAQNMALELEKLVGKPPLFIEEISPITAISAGDGAVAVSYTWNETKESTQ